MSDIVQCPVCLNDGQELVESIDVRDQHQQYAPHDGAAQKRLNAAALRTSLHYNILRCRACDLHFCQPLRAPDAEWYGLAYRVLNLYPADRWEFNLIASRISNQDRVLELGCGSGEFLKRCREAGARAYGVDFSDDAINACHKAGLDAEKIAVGSLANHTTPFTPTKIVAFHVLEHLDDPLSLFETARTWSSVDTELWVSIPSQKRPSRYFGDKDFLDAPPHHMTRWTEAALRAIGARSGWRLREMLYEPLGLRTASWHIAIHCTTYRMLKASRVFSSRNGERLARLAHYPYAASAHLLRRSAMSGFTMTAGFERQ